MWKRGDYHMSLLDLNIDTAAGPGRRPKPVDVTYLRDVTEADLELLATRDAGSTPSPVQRITERHHALARLLASGTPEGEAALITGYDPSRVSVLKNSPAFTNLIAIYRDEVNREFSTSLEHMGGLSRDALLELRQRVEDKPEDFSHRELLSIITELSDRAISGEDSTKHLPTRIELVAHVPDSSD